MREVCGGLFLEGVRDMIWRDGERLVEDEMVVCACASGGYD